MNQDLSKLGWMEEAQNGRHKTDSLANDITNFNNVDDYVFSKELNTESTTQSMFNISSTREVIDNIDNTEKKFVLYTINIEHGSSARADLYSTSIERRYTDFLTLYEGLKKEFPNLLNSYSFPRKAIVGNFSERLIEDRKAKFLTLLDLAMKEPRLRNSLALLNFLQEKELTQALNFCAQKRYDLAEPIFKYNFRLLNKVYTDRSPAVLLALCRLVGCYALTPGILNASVERWATLALHRYEGVSDSDLLMLYGPLLETCLKLWERNGKEWQLVKDRLTDMKRRGVTMPKKNLLEAVHDVDVVFRKLSIDDNITK